MTPKTFISSHYIRISSKLSTKSKIVLIFSKIQVVKGESSKKIVVCIRPPGTIYIHGYQSKLSRILLKIYNIFESLGKLLNLICFMFNYILNSILKFVQNILLPDTIIIKTTIDSKRREVSCFCRIIFVLTKTTQINYRRRKIKNCHNIENN